MFGLKMETIKSGFCANRKTNIRLVVAFAQEHLGEAALRSHMKSKKHTETAHMKTTAEDANMISTFFSKKGKGVPIKEKQGQLDKVKESIQCTMEL